MYSVCVCVYREPITRGNINYIKITKRREKQKEKRESKRRKYYKLYYFFCLILLCIQGEGKSMDTGTDKNKK